MSGATPLYITVAFIIEEGFLVVPYLMDQENLYPKARKYPTALKDGGIRVIDSDGKVVNTVDRYKTIINKMK